MKISQALVLGHERSQLIRPANIQRSIIRICNMNTGKEIKLEIYDLI